MKYKLSKTFIAVFSLLLSFQTVILAQAKTEIIVVADRQVKCTGVAPMKCLQIKKPQDTKWMLFYDQIENFRYKSGYFYLLSVTKTEVKNPPADASKFKYRLRRIINRERAEITPVNETKLSATKWVLTKIEGRNVNTDRAYVQFNEQKERFGGNGGCNAMGGTLKVEGSKIDMSEIISTKMFCQDTSDIENSFLTKLDDADRYEIKNDKLYLYADEKLILELTAPKK